MPRNLSLMTCLFLSLVYAPFSYGLDCLSKSPSFNKEGDTYFDSLSFDKSERAKNEPEYINKYIAFMRQVNGTWKGSSDKFVCYGSDKKQRKEHEIASVTYKANMSSNKSARHIFDRYLVKDKILKQEKILMADMSINKKDKNKEFYVILNAAKDKLALQKKYRLVLNDRAYFRENLLIFLLSKDKRKLTIFKSMYQFGVLVESETLELKRQ